MHSYPELGRALTGVEDDLKFWKASMTELAALFHDIFPPVAALTSGWTLHLRKCAKLKNCTMCPHSLVWRKFFYQRVTDETYERAGVKRRNKFMWGRKKEHVLNSFPADLRLSRDVHEMFWEIEKMRIVIMQEHRQLAMTRNRLLALKREADKRRDNQGLAPTAKLEVSILRNLTDLVTSDRPSKREVMGKLWDMRVRFTDALNRRKEERGQWQAQ